MFPSEQPRAVIQMDTREKKGKKDAILKAFEEAGVKVVHSKMYVGDYTLLHNPSLCIDTKQNLQEVYSNVITEHDRFRAECIRAREAGIRLVVLTEEAKVACVDDVHTWVNPRARVWKYLPPGKRPVAPPVSSQRIETIMKAMSERYGVEWQFCKPGEAGSVILKLLGVL